MHPSTMPDVGNEAESAAGVQLPVTGAGRPTVAQVVAIVAGFLAVVGGILMWRELAYTTMDAETGVSYFPSSHHVG